MAKGKILKAMVVILIPLAHDILQCTIRRVAYRVLRGKRRSAMNATPYKNSKGYRTW
jgi:hypothetical protein